MRDCLGNKIKVGDKVLFSYGDYGEFESSVVFKKIFGKCLVKNKDTTNILKSYQVVKLHSEEDINSKLVRLESENQKLREELSDKYKKLLFLCKYIKQNKGARC